jgi:peptide/nickel transport system permease protein
VVTVIGSIVHAVVGGSVIIEMIFGLPGLGTLMLLAINDRDYTVVSGIMMFVAVIMLLVNLVIDLTYGFLNPRVRVIYK